MKKILIASYLIIGILIIIILFFNTEKNMIKKDDNLAKIIRYPVAAGQFYPAQKNEIITQIQNDLQSVENIEFNLQPQILIVPHAGYIYSGKIMATAFKSITDFNYNRFIILGVSHHYSFPGIAASSANIWQTPLGTVTVDQEFINKLINKNNEVFKNEEYHQPEHALEVELPWLQTITNNNFKIVPLLLGNVDKNTEINLANTLNDLWDDNTLLIISSDLSHYPPYKIAQKVDHKILNAIVDGQVDNFFTTYTWLENNFSDQVDTFACGYAAIVVGMKLAEENQFIGKLLAYANSGDVSIGNKDKVVGYGAVIFGVKNKTFVINDSNRNLNKLEQSLALKFSRAVLENYYFAKDNLPDLTSHKIFQSKRGVFVTLRKKFTHDLRGCIGNVLSQSTLENNFKTMTLAAALDDARFLPVTANELTNIKIEISVLSPFQKITSLNEIKLGKHGVMVKQGNRQGIFLPQVATETGWNLNEFMSHLCSDKAGIPSDAWQTGQAEIYIFTAQVFSE